MASFLCAILPFSVAFHHGAMAHEFNITRSYGETRQFAFPISWIPQFAVRSLSRPALKDAGQP